MWGTVDRHGRLRRPRVGAAATVAGLPMLIAVALVAVPGSAAEKVSGKLFLRDALTAPGKPARIEARLVHDGLLGQAGLGGEPLELFVGKRSVATAMTGGDGRAFFEFTPVMRGTRTMTVRLASTRRVESDEATAALASWEGRRPILLVEVEALSVLPKAPPIALPSLPLAGSGDALPPPLPRAADALSKLTAYYYNVLYLARSKAGGPAEEAAVREWLQQHQFPLGVTKALDPGRAALEALLDGMAKEGWDNLKTGVGRTREFAEVLVERRLRVVILPGLVEGDKLPRKALAAEDWEEVRRKIQR